MKFEHLMHDFPRDSEAIKNLSDFFVDAAQNKRPVTLSFDRLFEIANPTSMATLARIIQQLIDAHTLTQVYRVEYGGAGIGSEFKSLSEIPEVLYDRDGFEVIPDLQNTKAYYHFPGENAEV
jgi:dTDP-4-dehydrorhamnose reductase